MTSRILRLVSCLILAVPSLGTAAIRTWQGSLYEVENWFNASLWSGGVVPGVSDSALINTQAGVEISGGSASINQLNISGGYFDPNLRIVAGGSLSTPHIAAAYNTAHYAHIVVRDPGSRLSVNGYFALGSQGYSVLRIENGGQVDAINFGTAFSADSSQSTTTVEGTNSHLAVSEALDIGGAGEANMIVKNGGTISCAHPTGIWLNSPDAGNHTRLIVGDGNAAGTINTSEIFAREYGSDTGGADLVLSHTSANWSLSSNLTGILTVRQSGTGKSILTGDASHTGGTFVTAGTLQVGNGGTTGSITGNINISNGASFTLNRSDRYFLNANMSGSGAFHHAGTGDVVMQVNQTFSGMTTVERGTMVLAISNYFSPTTLQTSATLAGTGQVNTATFQDESTLSPGDGDDSAGALQFNTLTLQGDVDFFMEIGAGGDRVITQGLSLNSAGRIRFHLDDWLADPMEVGESYRLLEFTNVTGLDLTDLSYVYGGLQPNFAGDLSITSTGIDFTLNTVPEPNSAVLVLLGTCLLGIHRRRRTFRRFGLIPAKLHRRCDFVVKHDHF